MMTDPRSVLDVIRQRADNATDGPWFGSMGERVVYGRIPGDEVAQCTRRADARFVQAARSDVPRLVAALEAVLDLADEPTTDEFGNESVYVDLLRAVVTDALTEEES